MSNNNEDPKPVRKTWMMIKKAPLVIKNWFLTKDNKKSLTFYHIFLYFSHNLLYNYHKED